MSSDRWFLRTAVVLTLFFVSGPATAQLPLPTPAVAPEKSEKSETPREESAEEDALLRPKASESIPLAAAPEKVDVQPLADDSEIAERLTSILEATEWYTAPRAEVRQGVVFLYGETSTARFRDWAGDLARNTQDVAAVVNRVTIRESSIWDLSPVWAEMEGMWRRTIMSLPYLLLGLVVLTLSFWAAGLGSRIADRMLASRIDVPLLRDVLSRLCGAVIFVFGIYFVLRIYGLTRLAMTLLGGTGIVGLVLGIAFRDISENFLASIFLSVQRPFRPGDLVQITTETGYVQRLNSRTTVLMTLDGNYVQIPNATVYKAAITNYMSNPNRRESFVVSIGYRETISDAQNLALKVLADHPAVLKDPEPWVLVDNLTPELIQLKVYYWINGRDHSFLKVRSSLIRLIKSTFQDHGIQLPPAPAAGLASKQFQNLLDAPPVSPAAPSPPPPPPRSVWSAMTPGGSRGVEPEKSAPAKETKPRERKAIATRAEGRLESEERELQGQADLARPPEDGRDLLGGDAELPTDEDGEAIETSSRSASDGERNGRSQLVSSDGAAKRG